MSSWITGLADKAENILNKLDQNAATALQTDNPTGSGDPMRRSMTSSTQSLSLKSTLSPAKRSVANSTSSVKSEGSGSVVTKEMRQKMSASPSSSNAPEASGNSMDTNELAAFKIALNEITAERDELRLRLNELNHDSENFALQQRSQELETLAQTLSEERDKAVHDLNEAQTAHMAYVHSISELETNLAKLQQEYLSAANKLQMQTRETEQQRQELQEYRTKAQRALQAKDALIAELKAKPVDDGGNTGLAAKDSETRFLQIECESLKQELEHANEELQKTRLQVDDYLSQERQRQVELSSALQREEALAKELRHSREHTVTSDSEQRILSQELASLRQQLSNQMAASATRLQEKEQQLLQMRQRLQQDANSGAKNDYEARLKALTQSLVERQGLLERVTSERNALRLQHEKIQAQLQQNTHMVEMESHRGGSRNPMLSNSTDDAKAQFPLLMHPSPFDNRVARRFKRALRQADSMGIRVGAFLRRYPMMRVSVIVYVALLHLWVMFVLLSTTPN
ncbi:golgin-84 [Drosophila serrata]|uniref:golgin-84 n=1 Tax=Drosophila serrata TaxID=7274 RepID=UPI000A1D08D8|nr:golgin-84 [Drosophila serrata]